jgi:hypothetical protein
LFQVTSPRNRTGTTDPKSIVLVAA